MKVMESKVEALREGSVLVTPEERLEVQGAYDLNLGSWKRRRKIYQELWGMITEAMTENLKDLKVLYHIAFKCLTMFCISVLGTSCKPTLELSTI